MQKVNREFIESLLSLIRNIQRAIELHQDLSGDTHNPAELITGSFNGIEVVISDFSPIFFNVHSVPVRLGASK